MRGVHPEVEVLKDHVATKQGEGDPLAELDAWNREPRAADLEVYPSLILGPVNGHGTVRRLAGRLGEISLLEAHETGPVVVQQRFVGSGVDHEHEVGPDRDRATSDPDT